MANNSKIYNQLELPNIGSDGILRVDSGVVSVDSSIPNTYLSLDQTTPQTVVNGAPVFNLGISSGKLTNLTSNGFVKTSGSDGSLSVDTATYLTTESDPLSLHLDQTTPQTFTGGSLASSGMMQVTEGVPSASFLINDSNGSKSAELDFRELYDTNENISINYNDRKLRWWDGASYQDMVSWGTVLKFGQLTSNGFVKASGGDGTISVDTNTYLTSADLTGYALLDGSNQPFTGDVTVSKADPVLKLTDTGNSRYSYLTRSDTSDTFWLYNRQQYNNGGGNLIPTMTSDTAPSGIAAASSVWDPASTQAYKAMDNNSGTYWASGSAASWWLRYKFAAVQTITGYSITARGGSTGVEQAPKTWTFQGSQDASAWTTLDTQTSITFSGGQTRSYTVTNETQYLYYRLSITAVGNNGTYCSIATFEMSNPTTTADVQLLKHIYSGTAYKMGSLTLGTYSPSSGTENIYEGFSHQINIVGTPKESISSAGHSVVDGFKYLYGTGSDASINYDGTNLLLNPKEVGSGYLNIKGVTLVDDAIRFTQTDGNEYIDSFADGFMDYGATTAHRFLADVKLTADSRKLYFGAGDDASVTYDGTDLNINTKEVGTGTIKINGVAAWSGTFTNGDGDTVTVTDGLITAVTPP